MSRRNNAFYQSFRDIRTNRTVPIYSKVGQAQFLLREYVPRWNAPGEQLLACRFAGTIHEASGDWELRQLQHLLQYFQNTGFEKRHGYVDPAAAREIEKEIVLRNGADDCGLGRDITPTVQLLAEMERGGPVFSQAERNLLLECTFHTGDHRWVEEIAVDMKEKNCSEEKIADICRKLEQIELSWYGMDTMDGIQSIPTRPPGFQMSLENCDQPETDYPPFAYYPYVAMPLHSIVLLDGTLLHRVVKSCWQSDLLKVDQTYGAPHYFKRCRNFFEIADEEFSYLQKLEEEPEETDELMDGGMTLG